MNVQVDLCYGVLFFLLRVERSEQCPKAFECYIAKLSPNIIRNIFGSVKIEVVFIIRCILFILLYLIKKEEDKKQKTDRLKRVILSSL